MVNRQEDHRHGHHLLVYVSAAKSGQRAGLIDFRFVVYASSAIYITGLPGITLEFKVTEQEALLGLSLFVLACVYQ